MINSNKYNNIANLIKMGCNCQKKKNQPVPLNNNISGEDNNFNNIKSSNNILNINESQVIFNNQNKESIEYYKNLMI